MQPSPHLSVILPAYQCSETIHPLYEQLIDTLESLTPSFELLFIEDHSPTEDWKEISRLAEQDPRVRGIRFSRNFGQHRAIAAGLTESCGEWVVVMDCDLQDKPSEIKRLYKKAQEGYLVVRGRRVKRQDNPIKRFLSWGFYRALSSFIGYRIDHTIANFGIYHRKAIDAINQLGECSQFFPLQVDWVGFPTAAIDIEHGIREIGSSSYNLRRMMTLGLNIVVSFSNKPLRLAIKLGFLMASTSMVAALYFLASALFGSYSVQGWSSLIISVWFLSGLILMFMGILGFYLGKVFDQTKQRPLYVVWERTWEK